MNNQEYASKINLLEEKISKLENEISMLYQENKDYIETEVAKATFHQIQAIHQRMDQFIFDFKMKNQVSERDSSGNTSLGS